MLIVICFAALYITAKENIARESIKALESNIILPEKEGEKQGGLNKPSENKFENPRVEEPIVNKNTRLSVFCVKLDDDNNLVSVQNYKENITQENKTVIQKYAHAAISAGDKSGIIEKFNLRYYVEKTERHTYISFLDMSQEEENIALFMKGYYVVLGVSWLVVLIISVILAHIAVKPVEKAWEKQKRFIADASHELKTPLTVITSSTDIMLSDVSELKPEHRKWLECTKYESQRMKELINGMLYLARSDDEMGKSAEGVKSIFNLSEVLTEQLLSFEIQCYEKGKELIQDVEDNVQLKGNETEIRQLIGIFLDNACKYSDEKGTITVTLKSSGNKCTLLFKNTGEPIPSHDVPHLFERFYRASPSRAREEGGYGLGLSIAKTIAEKHGIKVAVSSDESGTEFSLKFQKELN
jgi:signal transduction histidine kinase